jgi:hypothetical protein
MESRAMSKSKVSGRLIPDAQVCARYNIHVSTLANWDKDPALRFPKPIRINKRKFRDENELAEFDKACAAARQKITTPQTKVAAA